MKTKHLEKLINKLKKDGFLAWMEELKSMDETREIYLVGGALRDALLGINFIKDYDFVVRMVELNRLGQELTKLGKVSLVGKHFGVYKFTPKNKKLDTAYDIALPRTDTAKMTGGYRDFDVQYNEKLSIQEDLGRRDFTINALAYNIFNHKLIDEFGGIKDLADKRIKTVGNAYERFEEDYSRMLRAIRFACQLNFEIEQNTWAAIKKLINHINDETADGERIVPYEVIAAEFLKTFTAQPVRAFDLYDKAGVFTVLAPEILAMKNCPQPPNWHAEGDVFAHTRLCLKNLASEAFKKRFNKQIIGRDNRKKRKADNPSYNLISAELVIALLWHDVGKSYTIQTPENDGTDRLRFNNHDMIGAKIAQKNFEKMKLSAAPDFAFDVGHAIWLIERHHLFDTKTIKEMKNSTIEKYFFGGRHAGEDLLKMGFIDMFSSVRQDTGNGNVENFEMMLNRINELKKLGKDKKLPRPLLNGQEVMKILKIKPGIRVGRILGALREWQLSGKVTTRVWAIKKIKELK
ncbi:hypothetical protein AUJ29_00555 [Candidatus Kuenenbacteria bacterium CG1_02_38_13]|uniref:HD domain-containing protein n=1 Tax=Candidatus Kuenenbacteria bacterium CG1_02_38_13 TaxID=1805235 RepID=A0A1J4U426_9BACT|nr:MAG: hypothetical protein AUJ29_00555 [Candidatus Kuenenbacteria bacterium CG1_02_38_13]